MAEKQIGTPTTGRAAHATPFTNIRNIPDPPAFRPPESHLNLDNLDAHAPQQRKAIVGVVVVAIDDTFDAGLYD